MSDSESEVLFFRQQSFPDLATHCPSLRVLRPVRLRRQGSENISGLDPMLPQHQKDEPGQGIQPNREHLALVLDFLLFNPVLRAPGMSWPRLVPPCRRLCPRSPSVRDSRPVEKVQSGLYSAQVLWQQLPGRVEVGWKNAEQEPGERPVLRWDYDQARRNRRGLLRSLSDVLPRGAVRGRQGRGLSQVRNSQ